MVYLLPYSMYSFYNFSNPKTYFIIYGSFSGFASFAPFTYNGVTGLMAILTVYAASQIEVLNVRLEEFYDGKLKTTFNQIIEEHKRVIR